MCIYIISILFAWGRDLAPSRGAWPADIADQERWTILDEPFYQFIHAGKGGLFELGRSYYAAHARRHRVIYTTERYNERT